MNIKEIAEGVENLKDYTKKETLELASIFSDTNNSYAHAMSRVLKRELYRQYWLLAKTVSNMKLSIAEKGARDTFLAGKIEAINEIIDKPREFIDAVERLKKNAKNNK